LTQLAFEKSDCGIAAQTAKPTAVFKASEKTRIAGLCGRTGGAARRWSFIFVLF
jgi:hypothetical protein